ncbi:thioredoxin domain-containing protein 17 [Stomoxys calcitrans]|uniref:thioredoxin domain-containing protein 17 n=1 Tax=Stomoxys calcitrans TaxID=35570 RepID=UPI0027E31D6E|nr:thioredoxin domain-containing protein 17 [Stomoxys calcitrans]
MVRLEYTKGFDGFEKSIEDLAKNKGKLFVYFTGEKDDKGVSWCPDCNVAGPKVEAAIKEFAEDDTIFLTVDVGNRSFWKDMKNPFRLDSRLKLMVIPTLIRWKTVIKLEGDQCEKPDLLEMFFNED